MEKDREFEKSSLLLFALMMTVNAGNYLFQILLGRFLDVGDYGVFNSLNAVTGVLAVVGTAVAAVCCRVCAGVGEGGLSRSALGRLWRLGGSAAAATLFLSAVLSPLLAYLLHLENKVMVLLCELSAAVGVLSFVPAGIHQGHRRFLVYGLGGVGAVAVKLLLTVLLLRRGLGVWGALLSVLGYYLAYGVILLCAMGRQPLAGSGGGETRTPLGRYFAGVLLVQLCLSLLTNGDVVLVKALFDQVTAGLYASAAVIGKIATFVSGALVVSIFPLAARRQAGGEDPRPLLGRGLLYGVGLALLCAAVLVGLGRFLIPLLFGARYAEAVPLLLPLSAYVVPLSALTVLFNYQMALDNTRWISLSVLLGCALVALLSALWGSSVTRVMLFTGAVLTAVFFINLLLALGKEQRE